MCRRLLALPERQLQQVRLNNAIESQDMDKIVDATMDIKRTFFEDRVSAMPPQPSVFVDGLLTQPVPEAFQFEKLPCLRRGAEGGDGTERMFFSAMPITHSLSILDGSLGATDGRHPVCVKMFKNVMGFMRDRKYTYPETLGRELLEACLLHPELRDELFLQVVKQLRRNPKKESKYLGFVLLDMCLRSFPPSDTLENAVEYFLRESESVALVRKLHRIVYMGAVRTVAELPSESDIAEAHRDAVAAAQKPKVAKSRWSKLRNWAQNDAPAAKRRNSNKKVASMNWNKILHWAQSKPAKAGEKESGGETKDADDAGVVGATGVTALPPPPPSPSLASKHLYNDKRVSTPASSTPSKHGNGNGTLILTTPEVLALHRKEGGDGQPAGMTPPPGPPPPLLAEEVAAVEATQHAGIGPPPPGPPPPE